MKHGTRSTYVNHKCRCEPCTAASRAYNAKRLEDPVYRELHNQRSLARRHALRDEVQAMKLAAQCMDCDGVFEDPTKLEYDHRDPDSKLFRIADGIYLSRAALFAEIEKCDVVCQPCHNKRGWARGQFARGAHASS